MEALSFSADPDEYRRAFLFEGVSWRNHYVRVVHGELAGEEIREDALGRRRLAAWATTSSSAWPTATAIASSPVRTCVP